MMAKKKERQTIGKMTQSTRPLPPPTRADVVRKKSNDRKKIKDKLRKGDYDV